MTRSAYRPLVEISIFTSSLEKQSYYTAGKWVNQQEPVRQRSTDRFPQAAV